MSTQTTPAQEATARLLETEDGRHLIYEIINHCGIYNHIDGSDIAETNRKLGKREIGLLLLSVVNSVKHGQLRQLMETEANNRQVDVEVVQKDEQKTNKAKRKEMEKNFTTSEDDVISELM